MTNSAAKEKPPFVVGSTSSRIPVEKWSRAELEDRFHATYTRNLELAQRNAHLEKDLVVLNGRLRRLAGRVGGKDEWTQEKADLERKNRLLAQKLKSLKHQLLVYTRPTAQAATINHLTDSAQHLRADALRSNESSHASAQLAEQELRHLRDEVRLLRSNNEKLEKTIFERETAKRTPTADLAQIKQLEAAVQAIQQQNAELERRRAKAEAERSKLSAKYKKLRSQLEKLSSRLESHSVFPPAPAIAPPAVEVNGNSKHEPPKVERTRRKDSTKPPVGILDRLFDDVVNLVDSHLGRSSSSGSAGREEDDLKDVRWQNMYESMYGELEKLTNGTMRTGEADLVLQFTRLLVTADGLKKTTTAAPSFFLMLEFFDFEFQITPLIQGPDARLQLFVVSDLFVHYLQTDGVHVELYEVLGTSHNLWGSATIPLKSLLSSKSSKRRQTAATFLPLDGEPPDAADRAILVVRIERARDLRRLWAEDKRPTNPPRLYAAYQLFDLPPHSTPTTTGWDPEFADEHSWSLPLGASLHRYLKAGSLEVQNQKIARTFPLKKADGSNSEAQLDVSIFWKEPYSFNDEDVEVTPARNGREERPEQSKKPPAYRLETERTEDVDESWEWTRTRRPRRRLPATSIPTSPTARRSPSSRRPPPDAPLSVVPPSAEFEPPAFSDSDDESGSTFTKDPDDQLDRPEIGQLPEDLMLESDEEEEAVAPSRPAACCPRWPFGGRAVEFKEPLHSSIPPSETSSFAADFSNGEEAAESSRPPRPPRSQPRLDSPATQSVLRPRPNVPERPARRRSKRRTSRCPTRRSACASSAFRLLDHSPLLAQEFECSNSLCRRVEPTRFSAREECETQELPISRDARDPIDFNFERVYQLSWRRIALLRQWMSLGTKLKFVLVLEPSADGPASTSSGDTADDVAEAALDLQEVIDSNRHTISLFDVEMEPIALLEVEVDLSDALWQHFEELVDGGTSAE
ncbi:C2-C2-1 domain-containing protein [Aphelenchoides fujianensis]|nr:C2-C2-1 domain-containing protein [Aphelenchoides fujianensis]